MSDNKFRALVHDGDNFRIIHSDSFLRLSVFFYTLEHVYDDYRLMRYTGVKDKHNKEIYELDVVFQNNNDITRVKRGFIGVVKQLEGCWVIDNMLNHAKPLWSESNENEIIGNSVDIVKAFES